MTAFGAKCPHCDTLFKVYPDQLRLHNGYANCGACGLSFDVQTALLLLPPHQTQFLPSQPDQADGLPVLNAVAQIDAATQPADAAIWQKDTGAGAH